MPSSLDTRTRGQRWADAADAAVKQLSAMTKDELTRHLRRKLRVVGPLPETRMELLSLAMDVAR